MTMWQVTVATLNRTEPKQSGNPWSNDAKWSTTRTSVPTFYIEATNAANALFLALEVISSIADKAWNWASVSIYDKDSDTYESVKFVLHDPYHPGKQYIEPLFPTTTNKKEVVK